MVIPPTSAVTPKYVTHPVFPNNTAFPVAIVFIP